MHGGHLVEVFFLLLAAQLVGWLFARLKQPVVIGEVLAGVLVGPALLGLVHDGEILEFLAELGAIFLLFMVGLETRLRDILAVGKEAFLVAVLGVLFPFVGGYFFGLSIGFAQLPALFLGTALVATSVGITARVLLELGVLSRNYSRIILGAAVIDDVLGLIVLAVVNGVAQSGTSSWRWRCASPCSRCCLWVGPCCWCPGCGGFRCRASPWAIPSALPCWWGWGWRRWRPPLAWPHRGGLSGRDAPGRGARGAGH